MIFLFFSTDDIGDVWANDKSKKLQEMSAEPLQAACTLFADAVGMNADCVEALPSFACTEAPVVSVAAYQLDESSGARNGKVSLYNYSAGDGADGTFKAERIQEMGISGVFDLKWCVKSA